MKFFAWLKILFTPKKDATEITLVYPPTAPKPVVLKVPEPPKPVPVSMEAKLRETLVHFWRQDLGQREDMGKNRSLMIDNINLRLGVPLGSPYCIGGLLTEGVEPLCKMFNLKNPIPMEAGTQSFWQAVPEKYKYPKGKLGKKADICILQNKADAGHGHAYGLTQDELVQSLTLVNSQKTIEYNTNKAGSRDGDGVWELERSQDGTLTKNYLGAVDVVRWVMDANGIV